MPICIHTICFKEWGRECAMHFRPPMCCVDCLRVSFGWLMSLGRIVRGWLVSFGWIARGQLMSFVWIVCKWLFCLCGIAWKNMMEVGRGGACVPARVALSRAHPSLPPCAQCVCFWYGNAAARTFGRAHRHRPYGVVWGWIACGRLMPFWGLRIGG